MSTPVRPRGGLYGNESGFSLVELMMSVAILMIVSGMMMRGTLDMNRMSAQQSNRSEMHAGIRNATALLQQEVGQAGRVSFPMATVALSSAVTTTGNRWIGVTPGATLAMFPGMRLLVDLGATQEIIAVDEVNTSTNQIRATFAAVHTAGAAIRPAGGFAEGVIPTTRANGSTPSVLKIVGDINSNGVMVYVEYTCDWTAGRLYRNMMSFTASSKPALSVEQVLLDNLLPNPPNLDGTPAPCFIYDQETVGGITYVINVAIMTTVRTHAVDPITKQYQTVTKALLNVAPRNVFHAWEVASLGYMNRIQPLPPSVVALLN